MTDDAGGADRDLLTGCEEISKHLGWSLRATRHRHEKGELPTFTLGSGRTVYARRSTLAKHFAAQEAAQVGSKAE